MANVAEAKQKYLVEVSKGSDCTKNIQELQAKADLLQESLPGLGRAVETAEKVKVSALDAFALSSSKTTEAALKAARAGSEDAQKKLNETHELIESVARTLKRQESELLKLNNTVDLARRECWQAVFDEIKSAIPKHLFGDMKTLFIAGVQCSMTRQFILDSLFPNIPSGEFQEIRNELCEKYKIE